MFPGRGSRVSETVTGRRPFRLDPDTEYKGEDGVWMDSSDEWEEEEEGESLSDRYKPKPKP